MQTARSYGLIGTSTVTVPELRILNAKSDDAREDLRIGSPFAALREYVDALDLATLGALEFGHVPYLVLLVKAMDAWRRGIAGGGGDVAAAAVRSYAAPASLRPARTPCRLLCRRYVDIRSVACPKRVRKRKRSRLCCEPWARPLARYLRISATHSRQLNSPG